LVFGPIENTDDSSACLIGPTNESASLIGPTNESACLIGPTNESAFLIGPTDDSTEEKLDLDSGLPLIEVEDSLDPRSLLPIVAGDEIFVNL